MNRRAFTGSLPHTLSAVESNQGTKQSFNLQSRGIGTRTDKLYGDGISRDDSNHDSKKEQNTEVCANRQEKLKKLFLWAGICSSEIYMIHGLLLNIFKSSVQVRFSSIQGYLLTAGNFALTIGLCAIVIGLLNQNKLLKKVLSIR